MNWYSGNIAEAVQRSKQEGALFFVAIFGEDETSKKLEEALATQEVNSVLSTKKYVCIRLAAESQEHTQFKQIYSNAESPCLYFISLMGAPVEIVHGETSVTELLERCESAWSKHSKVAQSQKAPAPTSTPATTSQAPTTSQVETAGAASSSTSAAPANTGQGDTAALIQSLQSDTDADGTPLTLDQKIERARQLAAARAKLKMEEEAEEVRRRERERREAGKGMAELKRWQEEEEAKRMVEERKRDKRQEQELRQRLREQIAQDRAERNKRSNASIAYDGAEVNPNAPSGSGTTRPSVISSAPVNYAGKARLQFRMPDGSSQNHTFEQDATLGHVRKFLIDGQHVKFSLCVAFPRREFTSGEYTKTLKDLGLLPSSALLVLPAGGNVFSVPGGSSGVGVWAWVTTLLGYLLFPVTYFFGMMQRALPSSGGNSASTSDTQPSSRSSKAATRAENRLGGSGAGRPPPQPRSSRDTGGSSEDVRKRNVNPDSTADGNVHRLRNQETDSDDELGTWNGNSTQQKPR